MPDQQLKNTAFFLSFSCLSIFTHPSLSSFLTEKIEEAANYWLDRHHHHVRFYFHVPLTRDPHRYSEKTHV